MKTHTLGVGLFVEFILTHERNEKQNVDKDGVNCGNANLYEDMIVAVVIAIYLQLLKLQ